MSPTSDAAAFLGRLLLSVIFVLSGFQKLTQFSGTVAFMGSEGLPLPLIAAIVAVLVECVGGILLIFGYQTRLTGSVLAAWCIATALVASMY
jgi:putative oxidoreductase